MPDRPADMVREGMWPMVAKIVLGLGISGWIGGALAVVFGTSGPACRTPLLLWAWTWPVWKVAPESWLAGFVEWSLGFCP